MKLNLWAKSDTTRKPICYCGKVCFDKKTAITKKNWLENKGREKKLRVYQCPKSNTWHLTKQVLNKNGKTN